MRIERRRLMLYLPAAVLATALCMILFAFLRAQRTLTKAVVETRHGQELPYTLLPFDPTALAAANPGFEPIAATLGWTTGVELGDSLFLAGPAGLAQISSGTLVHLWRTGVELPSARITAVTTGRLRGASEPQVLFSTAGAGAFLLIPGPHPAFAQILPANLEDRDLTSLLPTASGDLLLGTRRHGLLRYSGEALRRELIHLPETDAAALQITALAASGQTVLVGTRNAGAFLLNGGVAERFSAENGLPDDEIESLAMAPAHAYVGTPVGVAEIDLSASRVTRTLAPGLFARALALSDGALTVGTMDQGIRTVSLAPEPRLRMASLHTAPFRPEKRVEALLQTGSGMMALAGGTVLRRTADGWTSALAPAVTTLSDPNVSALLLAPDGRLWVGLFDHGIDVLSSGAMSAERHLEDDHLFCIDRLALDPVRGTVAAGTANGLVLFDTAGNPRQTLTRRDGLIADHVNDLVFTPAGLAVGTPAGITFLNASGPESLYAFQGLVNNHVYTLAASADGRNLLAGTLGGLSLLESEQVRRSMTATNSPLRHNWITATLAQGPGEWLIGTYGAGLAYVKLSATGEPSVVPAELPADAPRDLVINPNALLATPNAIYAGTLGQGMLVYDKAARRWTLVQQGLPSLNVTAFAAGAGTLYVGTENGLMRIAESRLTGGAR